MLNVGRCLREKEEEREGRENAIGKGTEVEEEKSKYWEKVEGGCLLLEVFFVVVSSQKTTAHNCTTKKKTKENNGQFRTRLAFLFCSPSALDLAPFVLLLSLSLFCSFPEVLG